MRAILLLLAWFAVLLNAKPILHSRVESVEPVEGQQIKTDLCRYQEAKLLDLVTSQLERTVEWHSRMDRLEEGTEPLPDTYIRAVNLYEDRLFEGERILQSESTRDTYNPETFLLDFAHLLGDDCGDGENGPITRAYHELFDGYRLDSLPVSLESLEVYRSTQGTAPTFDLGYRED